MILNVTVFFDLTPYILVQNYQSFGTSYLTASSTLRVEAAYSSEMTVNSFRLHDVTFDKIALLKVTVMETVQRFVETLTTWLKKHIPRNQFDFVSDSRHNVALDSLLR